LTNYSERAVEPLYQFNKPRRAAAFILSILLLPFFSFPASGEAAAEKKSYIKYVEFNPTLPVLEQAWEYAVGSRGRRLSLILSRCSPMRRPAGAEILTRPARPRSIGWPDGCGRAKNWRT
jgi:hypothetical protein